MPSVDLIKHPYRDSNKNLSIQTEYQHSNSFGNKTNSQDEATLKIMTSPLLPLAKQESKLKDLSAVMNIATPSEYAAIRL